MITEPQLDDRSEQHYVAIRTVVPMSDIGTLVPPLIPRVYEWLQDKNEPPAGALFFRYVQMDEEERLDVEVGVPVSAELKGDDEIQPGSFPAGRYLVTRYKGSYDGLPKAWRAFDQLRTKEGLAEQEEVTADGTVRGTRAEHYLIGPDDDPEPANWETELVFFVGAG